MITPQTILGYAKAQPFRASRLHLASGRTFGVRHPEMVKVLRSHILIFQATGDTPDIPDEWESVPMMLIESISHLEAPVH